MNSDNSAGFDFDIETQAHKIDGNQWQLVLSPDWSINGNPNGGYLLACLLRSMALVVPDHPDPISVTTHYLRPGLPLVQATLSVEVVRIGRRTATLTGTLEQDGKSRIITTATFGTFANSQHSDKPATDEALPTTERRLTVAPPQLPPPDQCIDRQELMQGVDLAILSRVEIRIDPRYSTPGKASDANIAGWLRFTDSRPCDIWALPLFCDAFPPSIFSLYGMIGWVPTVELGLHIRQHPTPGWIKAQFTTRDVAGELFIEDGMLWDESDQLVAQSRQLQMILQQ